MWYVFLCTLLWMLIYAVVCKVTKNRSSECNCRIVAMMHALLITKLVEACLIVGPWPFSTLGSPNTLLQIIILTLSTGYFIFDILWCVAMGTEGPTMLAHHVISLVSLIGGLVLGSSGSELTAVIWGSEITNPFLQVRWFLREIKQYGSVFAKINDAIFIMLFAIARVGIGGYLAFLMHYSVNTVWWIKLGGYAFYIIGLIWMVQIAVFARKRFYPRVKLAHHTPQDRDEKRVQGVKA